MKPDVSVVIPTHNRRDLLQTTLRSILDQQGASLEVIVVDDGSVDATSELVAAIEDRRVRVLRHERATGVCTARNHGAAVAAGRWLAFCDDDDVWAPEKLARELHAAAIAGCTWSYAGDVRVDSVLAIIGGTPPPPPERLTAWLPRWNLMPGGASNVIVQAGVFHAAGGWDPALVNLADWDLWARLAQHGPPACVAAPLVGYRIHAGNASADTALIQREAKRLDGRYGAPLHYGELYHYLAWVSHRAGHRRTTLRHMMLAAARGSLPAAARMAVILARARAARVLPALGPTRTAAEQAWLDQGNAWVARLRRAQAPPPPECT